jgi:hypothetical protein
MFKTSWWCNLDEHMVQEPSYGARNPMEQVSPQLKFAKMDESAFKVQSDAKEKAHTRQSIWSPPSGSL